MSADGKPPYTQLSLLEYYIRKTNLKSIVRSDLVAGDVTGQWNLMLDWTRTKRTITKLVQRNPQMELDGEELEDVTDLFERNEETEEEEVISEGPDIVDFSTADLAVIPPTCTELQKARAVAIRLRLSPDKVREMVDEGVFILPRDTEIDEFCEPDKARDKRNMDKKQTKDAGIKTEGTYKYALIYMVYTRLVFGGEHKESGIVYFSGQDEICGLIKNPLWSGKVPILSAPVERVQGTFFGQSKIEPVKFMQWNLNDFFNMGQDSAMYSLLPIWAADPLKCPQWASLVMGLAAVWPVAPDGIKPITSPQLWKDSAQLCDMMKRQIWESMDVNEMMMGKMPAGRKNNQLMGAMQQEQQINITDHATRYEEVMLNPLLEMMFEFDQQYRTAELMIETRGEIGAKAAMEIIEPQQWDNRYFFRWTGTEFMASMQRMQQQIAWFNVLKGIPPQMLGGKTLDVSPMAEMGTENMFGPEMAPRILVDKRNQYTLDPEIENEILHNGMAVDVHEADDDPAHLQAHMKGASMGGDVLGLFKLNMGAHMAQMQKKREMQAGPPQGLPGSPGGAGPGAAGAPKPGAMPAPGGPRPAQQPPGAIQQDAMMGAAGRG